jgi:predicted house-cleaning noncanonical NTP pyrophosphatase (MazG superfamily)
MATDETMEAAVEKMFAPIVAEQDDDVLEEVQDDAVEAETADDDVAEEETSIEDEDEDTEDADPEPASKFTVKVDGTEVEVSLDDLKRSYSGQAYIQKGMQEAAEAKKQATTLYETLQKQQSEFLSVVQQVQQQGFQRPPQEPDMAMMDSDPIGYMQAEARYRKEMSAFVQQQQQLQQVQAQQSQLQERAMQEYLKEQLNVLQSKIPEFSDAKKAGELRAKLIKTGAEAYGFSEAELGGITDARHVQVLHDAAKWRELQASKAVAKKPHEAPRSVKPAGKRPEPMQLTTARKLDQARKSGKPEAFIDLMFKRN